MSCTDELIQKGSQGGKQQMAKKFLKSSVDEHIFVKPFHLSKQEHDKIKKSLD